MVNLRANKIKYQTQIFHIKKLKSLGINVIKSYSSDGLLVKSREFFKDTSEKQIVYNLSERNLSPNELNVLKKGLKYGIKSKKNRHL